MECDALIISIYFYSHSDSIGGSLAVNDDNLFKILKSSQSVTGTISE